MINLFYSMFEWVFALRAAVGMLILLFIWMIFGKCIIWILSAIPYVLEKFFMMIYIIVNGVINFLHKLYGRDFYKLHNKYAEIGEWVYNFFEMWYKKWHSNYKIQFGKACSGAIICYLYIVVPFYMSEDIGVLSIGKNMYCSAENSLKEMVEAYSKSDLEKNWFGTNKMDTSLIVYNVNTTLYVRDIPDRENCVVVEKLYNGDIVRWTGEIIFVEWENDEIEPLVKVITENGIEGWSLLDYLYPIDYDMMKFKIEVIE